MALGLNDGAFNSRERNAQLSTENCILRTSIHVKLRLQYYKQTAKVTFCIDFLISVLMIISLVGSIKYPCYRIIKQILILVKHNPR